MGGVALIASVSAWSAGWLSPQLVDPAEANREQLLHWLATTRITDHPIDLQERLVERLMEEFQDGWGEELSTNTVPAQYQQNVDQNIPHLKQTWFHLRARQYAICENDSRLPFLLQQVETAQRWSEALKDETGSDWVADVDTWLSSANDDQHREQLTTAVSDGLICWLATDDLSQYDEQTTGSLADRLASELDANAEPSDLLTQLSDSQLQQFQQNGQLLARLWFTDCTQRYHTLPTDDREAFVDQQMARIESWKLDRLLLATGQQNTNPIMLMMAWKKMTSTWLREADQAHRQPLHKFIQHCERRFLAKLTGGNDVY